MSIQHLVVNVLFFFSFLSLRFSFSPSLLLLSVVRVYSCLSFLSCCLFLFFFDFSFFFLYLSFCSESAGSLGLNFSSLFFLEIANKQIGNFGGTYTHFRELHISQFDHKSEFLLKNLQACISQKLTLLDHSKLTFCPSHLQDNLHPMRCY